MDKLVITHNAGFFSCCTIRLIEIVNSFNKNKNLPTIVDSSRQFEFYKSKPEDISKFYFTEKENNIEYNFEIKLSKTDDEEQFSDYKLLNFDNINPFVEKYFSLSNEVNSMILEMEQKYNIDYENTITVFYRGNDKVKETNIGSYDEFLNKTLECSNSNSEKKIIIQTDDQGFLNYCKDRIDNSKIIVFDEIPSINSNPTIAVHHTIISDDKKMFAAYFLAITKIVSKSNILITHSGNCGMWVVLFRGNTNNVYQYLNSKNKSQLVDGWI
jgi:hypothetical protein